MNDFFKNLSNFALPKLNGWHKATAICVVLGALFGFVAEQKSNQDEYQEMLEQKRKEEEES